LFNTEIVKLFFVNKSFVRSVNLVQIKKPVPECLTTTDPTDVENVLDRLTVFDWM